MRILVTVQLPQPEQDYLVAALPQAAFRFAGSPEGASDDDLAWAEVLFGNVNPPERVISHRALRWQHVPNIGMEMYDRVRAARPDLRITNASDSGRDTLWIERRRVPGESV